jgi:glycosyltransferase 2 family protein
VSQTYTVENLSVRDHENQGVGRATGRSRLLRWGLVAAIFVGCAFFLDLGAVVEVLRRVSGAWLLLIFGLMTVDRFLMAWKWSVLLEALGVELSFGRLVGIYYQGSLAGIFLPSGIGGDLLRAHWVSKETGATHQVYASLIMEKMIGFISAANWACIGVAVFLSQVTGVSAAWAGAVVASAVLANGLFLLSLHPRMHDLILRGLDYLPHFRMIEFLQRLYEAYRQFGKHRGALAWNGFLTAAEHGLQLVVALTIATSLGLVQDVLPFLAVTALYLLIYRLPISPDGWGIGEVASIGLYGLIGMSPESAFGLAFFAHVMQMLVVLPGAWFFVNNPSSSPRLKILPAEKFPRT